MSSATEESNASRFRRMFDEEWDAVVRYLARRGPTAAAEDLAADVFTLAWQKLDEVPREAELPWLYKSARYLLLNARRLEWRTIAVASPQETDGGENATGLVELAHDVGAALRLLSDVDREVIALTVWERLSADEAAIVLGCRPATYRVRLHRARRRLEAALRRAPRSSRLPPPLRETQEGARP
ncbi:MAG: RNA polymerase sigma factor [Vicinamibacteraceae bacterium]